MDLNLFSWRKTATSTLLTRQTVASAAFLTLIMSRPIYPARRGRLRCVSQLLCASACGVAMSKARWHLPTFSRDRIGFGACTLLVRSFAPRAVRRTTRPLMFSGTKPRPKRRIFSTTTMTKKTAAESRTAWAPRQITGVRGVAFGALVVPCKCCCGRWGMTSGCHFNGAVCVVVFSLLSVSLFLLVGRQFTGLPEGPRNGTITEEYELDETFDRGAFS